MAKAEVFRLFYMGDGYICKFPETSAIYELAKHQGQHVVPMSHRPTCGTVVEFVDYTSELPLWKKLYYLRKNE